ncbi:MAG: sn-glycerol-3-phosphate ABC transporter ATP-binding protein UgpC [Bradyrhizobium sp.]|nr:sn-glycerol-3-phosphate ABC transporter ATP-binding protein UgpC [Bradyrhizobium sp.]
MASVTLKNIVKKYGDIEVVHGVDLTIEDGSFVVLLGPSGCGKSTLLRMIAGLESVTGGDVEIAGKRVNDKHPKDRNIAMVFQNYALYAHMTVKDNMSFSLVLAKRPQSEIDEKTGWAAKILNLEPYLKRYPRELSGGQRQRVAMGRAIVRDPAVFLFDEPLSNLDAKLRVQMRTEIKDLHERLKTTTVYVTHDQIEAMTMADKIVVMQGGRIEQVGAPLELYDRPANIFVASFIGSPSMNLIDGVVKDGMVDVDGARLALPPGSTATEGQQVVYGVRPETFTAGNDGLAGTIAVVEPTGSETHVVVRIAGREVTAVFRERVSFRPGETITLAPDATQSHIFDKASGQRLA